MNSNSIKDAMRAIAQIMQEHKEQLVKLDQQNGDGDLGLYMSGGFAAVSQFCQTSEETDLGRLFQQCSRILNENAPSSLGTILSIGLMGVAKALKGETEISVERLAEALENGLNSIMQKAGSKPGEKTVLDALVPAVNALKQAAELRREEAFSIAAKAAKDGSESTRQMRAVHGRAAYYGEKSLGLIDGGSVAGSLIFEGISNALNVSADN